MQGKIIVSSSSSSVSHHRYCNLQRNSEALKAKKDTHTYAHIHEHTPHEEHWHTYAHIHEHTLTQHNRKNIGTYTTHIHSRERVLAGIHHAYNKYTFSHTRYAHNTQKKFKDTGTYSLTHTEKQHIVTKKACPIRTMACTSWLTALVPAIICFSSRSSVQDDDL